MAEKLILPISETDIEEFKRLVYEGEDIVGWTFNTDSGITIEIEFATEDEYNYED